MRRVRRCRNYGSHADASQSPDAAYLHDRCGVRTLSGLLPILSSSCRMLAVIIKRLLHPRQIFNMYSPGKP